jgi:hypothetical protein
MPTDDELENYFKKGFTQDATPVVKDVPVVTPEVNTQQAILDKSFQYGFDPNAPNTLGGTGVMAQYEDDYKIQEALKQAKEQYKFIPNDVVATVNKQSGDRILEAWSPEEEGYVGGARPKEIPLGKIGLEIYNPDKVSAEDIAADVLHHDKFANEVRDKMTATIKDNPEQLAKLKESSLDYQNSLDAGMSKDQALKNAVDSAMRGYVVGQWSEKDNAEMGYSDKQQGLLDNLKSYMVTGKVPK